MTSRMFREASVSGEHVLTTESPLPTLTIILQNIINIITRPGWRWKLVDSSVGG
jgi:hypothetical protein